MVRRSWDRPRADAMEWEECIAASGGLREAAYALWLQLWHSNADSAWGDLLKETRLPGYDGSLF